MKKFAVLSLIGLLIVAFGITAYAQEKAPVLEFKASGFIDVISEYTMNVPQPGAGMSGLYAVDASGSSSTNNVMFGPPPAYMLPAANQQFDKASAYMENRGRLKFDAIMGKDMMGTFYFEIDSTRWGERASSGVAGNGQRNYAGNWSVLDRAAVEVKNMFITAGLPVIPVPTLLQAGLMPLVVRPDFFLATDGPGVTVTFKPDPLQIKLAWFKALENKDWAADDQDLYAIEANAKIQTLTVGGYAVFFKRNSYALAEGEPSYRSDMWWFGAYADGKVGPVNINLDLGMDTGWVKDRRDAAPADKVDYRGWGAVGKVTYPIEKLNVGFQSVYGSGADQKKTAASGLPGATVANTSGGSVASSKVGSFNVPEGTEGSVGYDLIFTGLGINRMNTGFLPAASTADARATFGGLWINKLFADYMVTPDFKTSLAVMYIRDTTKNGNTIGNARDASGFPKDDNNIGVEINWVNDLSIYKNLTFSFGLGYLFAGNAMDYWNGTTSTNDSPKNPYVITTKLIYAF
jgi:hypothetical protein